jgi:signal transduction histidine kinase
VGEIDLKAVIEDSIDATGQLFRARNVALEAALPAGLPPVRGDRDRVVQVLVNLLSNAAKFAPPDDGRVVVTLSRRPGALRVAVADNGPGVDRADQRLIFEKFRQAGDTLTEKPQGTGLGLPISRQIVEHLGGRLWVDSEPGAGATFAFELPVAAADEAADRAAQFAAAAARDA